MSEESVIRFVVCGLSIFLIFLIFTNINENKETVNPLETRGFGLSLDWITGGDFGKKFRRIRKEDKLNYKI